jgi:ABC-type lipoprotein export system ATPase subunit
MRDLLFELHRDSGTTLVLVTHDLAFARAATACCSLHDGRLHELPAGAQANSPGPAPEKHAVPA